MKNSARKNTVNSHSHNPILNNSFHFSPDNTYNRPFTQVFKVLKTAGSIYSHFYSISQLNVEVWTSLYQIYNLVQTTKPCTQSYWNVAELLFRKYRITTNMCSVLLQEPMTLTKQPGTGTSQNIKHLRNSEAHMLSSKYMYSFDADVLIQPSTLIENQKSKIFCCQDKFGFNQFDAFIWNRYPRSRR